ncbi:phosphoenolpyruvate synthase [candidate division WS5 bacterium]|uniref:Phosphoenolpyruvate synthase n=1 Tax=candidate division WS5 bacterium TaxID=2093353 RepID=A0A419DG55_9BACT|nr:MAG: phosphoenolpyruvate synthase [candidate division WS5 bacterium]
MKDILWFDEVGKDDGKYVGGKGANLGELTRAGLPVPKGFIVTAQAYFDFLEKTKLKARIAEILEGLDVEDSKDLQKRAVRIQIEIKKADFPHHLAHEIIKNYHKLAKETHTKKESLYVAVRSSATAEDLADASFAGQQATYLNVLGDIKVLHAVLKCWASLFEARAIYYREDKGFDQLEVGIAVPVQQMVNADKAGVMFTIDPTNNDMDHISIEAAYGLGEVVVLGALTPDRYLVDKKTQEITDKEIHKQTWMLTREGGSADTDNTEDISKDGVPVPEDKQEAQKLTDEEIMKLTDLALKIEEHYGKPQDTEWAVDRGEVYMLQSRPITTLDQNANIKNQNKDEKGTDSGQAAVTESNGTDISQAEVILKGSAASVGMAGGPVKIIHSPSEIDKILEGDVLVTEMTTPDFVPAMKRASAIVTDEGGRTCHAAIVSRELGIPCVVGTETATETLKKYPEVTVDGKGGMVYAGLIKADAPADEAGSVQTSAQAPLITATKIYVNLGEPDLAEKVASRDVDGVGLLRAEFIIMESIGEHPKKMIKEGRSSEYITKLADGLEKFARAFDPRPVIYRATDFKTNEYRGLKGGEEFEPEEDNPMIGYRGCFRYLKDSQEFKLELEAIKKVRQNFKNLHLMIPFVRRTDEFKKVKEIVNGIGLNKEQDPDFKLWIMVEVPSAVIEIEKYCQMGIDGVSIGSNDLTQLVLGLDRDSSSVAEEFDERYGAVQEMIKRTVETCRDYGITCSICGQAPSVYPEITQKMVEYGTTSISVNPDMIEQTRKIVAEVEERLLLKEMSDVQKKLSELEHKIRENE